MEPFDFRVQEEAIPPDNWQKRLARRLQELFPNDQIAYQVRVRVFRVLALADIALALYYFVFRYTRSINPNALWFALALLAAETYSFIDTLLFIFMMWKPGRRVPQPPLEHATVDVFITTYNEPVELVRKTAEAALRIRYPHQTWVLDDGNRPEMRAACEEIGCGYITRGEEWQGFERHAKAGNVNNALLQTSGEFILILDADQIPSPDILHRTLGYFRDPQVAFVQTPQYFYNVPDGDPFGAQAPLFYGPSKDGWNAAFFCGSNAVLRREALMQLGLVTYVRDTEKKLRTMLNQLPLELASNRSDLPRKYRQAADQISAAATRSVADLQAGMPLQEVLDRFHQAIREAQLAIVSDDLQKIQNDLAEILAMDGQGDLQASDLQQALASGLKELAHELADVAAPPPESLGLSSDVLDALQFDDKEALPVNPLATISITEDMATAMRLHALGWKSVFHSEILAYGLAPEDLGAMLSQRLRWAAGTIQVMIRENPLRLPGLSFSQRLQYFTTMYSYFSGFFAVVYLLAPVIYLLTGVAPVVSYAGEFLARIIPYLLVNQVMFLFVTWGMDVVRGQQYSLALFPIWIQAVVTVLGGSKLQFKVTPKTRQTGVYLNLVFPQLMIVTLLVLSSLYALFALAVGWRNDMIGVLVNIFWAAYDIWMLSVIIRAAVYRGEIPQPEKPPFGKRSFVD